MSSGSRPATAASGTRPSTRGSNRSKEPVEEPLPPRAVVCAIALSVHFNKPPKKHADAAPAEAPDAEPAAAPDPSPEELAEAESEKVEGPKTGWALSFQIKSIDDSAVDAPFVFEPATAAPAEAAQPPSDADGAAAPEGPARPTRTLQCDITARAAHVVQVEDNVVRTFAKKHGRLHATIKVYRYREGDPTLKPGEPPKPIEGTQKEAAISLDAADLLANEPCVAINFPIKHRDLPKALRSIPGLQRASFKISTHEPPAAEEGQPPPEINPGKPGRPAPLLHRALAQRFNPLITRPVAAKNLPDCPATAEQIDTMCAPPKIRFVPVGAKDGAAPVEAVGTPLPWTRPDLKCFPPREPRLRDVLFGDPVVTLAPAEDGVPAMLARLKAEVQRFEVHDRACIVEEPNVVVPPKELRQVVEEGDEWAEDEELVFGLAQTTLLDLVRGRTRMRLRMPLVPATTLRAAAGLDWKTRPGTYMEAGSYLKVDVKVAIPLPETRSRPVVKPFTRAVLLMDYRDTDMLHRVERTVRVLNSISLGHVPHPIPLPEPPILPEIPPEELESEEKEAEEKGEGGGASGGEGEGGRPSASGSHASRTGQSRHVSRNASRVNVADGRPISSAVGSTRGARRRRGEKISVREQRRMMLQEYEEVLEEARHARLAFEYSSVPLNNHTLQSLNAYVISPEQANDPEADLLTGFQLIDGKYRMVVVEGLTNGSMRLVEQLCQALMEARSAASDDLESKRRVMWNRQLAHPSRLYADWGIFMQQVKLRASLSKIVSEAGTYATGQVKALCMEGLRRLHHLLRTTWTRQAEDMRVMPTGFMVSLVSKKFGGELNRDDVLGWQPKEVRAREAGEGDFGAIDGDYVVDEHGRRVLRQRLKPHVEPRNPEFERLKAEADRIRAEADFHQRNLERIEELAQTRGTTVKEAWRTWNPQRGMLEQLAMAPDPEGFAQAMQSLLKDDPTSGDPTPGTISADVARARGWFPHGQQFKWPAPRLPGTFNEHPKKPTDARIEDLQQPWEEPVAMDPSRGAAQVDEDFVLRFHCPELLESNPAEYFQSVHLVGDGLEAERREAIEKEKADWKAKVVVADTTFRSAFPTRPVPAQTDRLRNGLLVDEPKKIGFKIAQAKPVPVNSQLAVPWNPGMLPDKVLNRKDDPERFLDERGFDTFRGPEKSAVFSRTAHERAVRDWGKG